MRWRNRFSRESVTRGFYGLPRLVVTVVPRLFDGPVTVTIRNFNLGRDIGSNKFAAQKGNRMGRAGPVPVSKNTLNF